ncbi:unnamed protein product [Phytophthora lilii]|uniref:Unnamed protein product n=1 Tax=Phytophthora lilii TaxID=2077276 RepID=A0A9W7CRC9_9STRA|nr:unnamed protein product [Phytophthora lilii]
MSREVYFQLVDKATRLPLPDTFVDAVDLAENASVIRFRRAVWDQVKSILPSNVIAANLRVYANRAVYDEQNAQPLDEDSPIGALGASEKGALIVVVPPQRLVPHTVAPAAESMAIPAAEPTEIFVTVEEVRDAEEDWQELTYYQYRGRLIQDKCRDYCAHSLDKVDEFYDGNERPIPFICVEGSSGVGKSQLAFALGGRRPWYY